MCVLLSWVQIISVPFMVLEKWSEVMWKLLSCVQLFAAPWTIHTVYGILQARILEWVAFPFSRGSSQLRYRTQVSHIAGRLFTSWATGKPKNNGVGSLSPLQRIFLNQELDRGLLHCRQILYQLSNESTKVLHKCFPCKLWKQLTPSLEMHLHSVLKSGTYL